MMAILPVAAEELDVWTNVHTVLSLLSLFTLKAYHPPQYLCIASRIMVAYISRVKVFLVLRIRLLAVTSDRCMVRPVTVKR